MVVVLFNGRALDVTAIEPLADAILEAWQPGVTGGDAVAALLCGKENPSGRLTLTFPRSVGQIPIYYNHRNSGRLNRQGLYQDIPSTPFYEFGYGLSYTTFTYAAPTLRALLKDGSETEVGAEPLKLSDVVRLTARVEVRNDGKMDGREVVQWYITDPYCDITAGQGAAAFRETHDRGRRGAGFHLRDRPDDRSGIHRRHGAALHRTGAVYAPGRRAQIGFYVGITLNYE